MNDQPDQQAEGPPCSTHPDAPHGFDRDGSHTAGRYVCDCEGWIPADQQAETHGDLRAELAAVQARYEKQCEGTHSRMSEIVSLRSQLAAAQAELARLQHENTAHRVAWQNAETQSAEEWVKERLFTQWDDDGNAQWYLCKTDALELARRCDEAENEAKRGWNARDEAENAYDNEWQKHSVTKAQLAAAQAEAAEMRKQRDLCGKQVLTLTAELKRLRKGLTEIKAGTRIGWFMTDLGAKCQKLLNP